MKNLINRKVRFTVNLTQILFVMASIFILNSCLEESPFPQTNFKDSSTGIVTDIDGNEYGTVTIGTQVWMTENLRTTKYRDGSAIPSVTGTSQWGTLTTGAYCPVYNNSTNAKTYGHLYNWYAVTSSHNIAPTGWHVPTYAEWLTLWNYLGGDTLVGAQLKQTGTSHWVYPNTGATDIYNFNAVPAGFRKDDGLFYDLGYSTVMWTASEYPSLTTSAMCWALVYDTRGLDDYNAPKNWGMSVRCVKDGSSSSVSPWKTKTSMPTARYGFGIAVYNNKIYVFGGVNQFGTYLSTVEVYDPSTDTWTIKSNMTSSKALAAATVGSKIYLIGGVDIKTVEEYDPALNTYTTKASMLTQRVPFLTVINNKIYAVGGYNSITGSLNTNEEYNPSTNIWTSKTGMITWRNSTPVSTVNNKLYATGGEYSQNSPYALNQEYDPSTNTWASKKSMPTARRSPASVAYNNKVYVIGGSNTSTLATIEMYDPSTDTWTVKTPMSMAREAVGVALVNNKIYVIGGELTGGTVSNMVEEYDPTLDP